MLHKVMLSSRREQQEIVGCHEQEVDHFVKNDMVASVVVGVDIVVFAQSPVL